MELQPKYKATAPVSGPITPAMIRQRNAILSRIPDSNKFKKGHKKLHYEFECIIQRHLPSIYPFIVRELEFSTTRKFKFDYCWPQYKVAIDIQGGIYISKQEIAKRGRGSGHISVKGMENDMEKINLAQCEGWVMLQISPNKIRRDPSYVVNHILHAIHRQGFR